MKYSLIILSLIIMSISTNNVIAQTVENSYDKTLRERADKIVKNLDIKDNEIAYRVAAILVDQYKSLGAINDSLDSAKKQAKQVVKDKKLLEQQIKNIENDTDAKLLKFQCIFIGRLSSELTNDQIEKVKDGMTYGVLKITYDSYLDMIPSLKAEEKRQLYAWLAEAREHAITASSSKDKHGWFGKYKGRINNYLSKQGYDIQKERKAWEERLKAQGKKL